MNVIYIKKNITAHCGSDMAESQNIWINSESNKTEFTETSESNKTAETQVSLMFQNNKHYNYF